jgi:amino acid permease
MTPEERELLTKSIKISEENNKILRGMRRSARIASALRIFYWVIILGSAFGTYYFIQPYIDAIVRNYNGMQQNADLIKNSINLPALPTSLGSKR